MIGLEDVLGLDPDQLRALLATTEDPEEIAMIEAQLESEVARLNNQEVPSKDAPPLVAEAPVE